MEFFNSLNLTQIKGGTKLKQGDLGSVLSYSLTDENGQEITSFDTKTAYINLVLDDKIWFTTTTLVDISRVTFRIDKAIPTGLYYLEIKIDDYIFPSDRDSIILIEEGSTPYDLKELVPNYDINMTIKGILSDLSQKGIDISDLKTKMKAIYNNALADHAEVAKARGSHTTLYSRLEYLQKLLNNVLSITNAITSGTESSAEVKAARLGDDGALYGDLAKSIRAQISNIYNSGLTFVDGYIDLNGNNSNKLGGWHRTDDFYPIEDIIDAEIQARPGASAIAYYDKNYNFVGRQGGDKIERIKGMIVPTNAKYVRFCFDLEDPTHAILTTNSFGVLQLLSQRIQSLKQLGDYEIINSLSDSRITDGYYIDLSDTLMPHSDWAVTDYFKITDVQDIDIPSRTGAIAVGYYNNEKELIDYEALGESEIGIAEKTTYVKQLKRNTQSTYVRFSIYKDADFFIKLKVDAKYNALDDFLNLKKLLGLKIITNADAEQEAKGQFISLTGEYKEHSPWNSLYNLYKVSDIAYLNVMTEYYAATVAYYDSNKRFIGSQGGDGIYPITKLTPPKDAIYVRFCFNKNYDVLSNFVVIKEPNSIFDAVKAMVEESQPQPWNGKNVGFIGDSITAGVGATKLYRDVLAEKFGFNQYTEAVSGAQVSSMLGYAKKLKSRNINYDVIFVLGGTNDFNASVEIGDFFTVDTEIVNKDGNMVELKKRTHVFDGTFSGRLNSLSQYLKANFPDTKIVYLTPIHRAYFKAGETNIQPSELYANLKGYFIDDYVKAVKQAGQYWSIQVVDLFEKSGLYPLDDAYTKYFANATSDRLHPNNLGHEKMAEVIAKEIFD